MHLLNLIANKVPTRHTATRQLRDRCRPARHVGLQRNAQGLVLNGSPLARAMDDLEEWVAAVQTPSIHPCKHFWSSSSIPIAPSQHIVLAAVATEAAAVDCNNPLLYAGLRTLPPDAVGAARHTLEAALGCALPRRSVPFFLSPREPSLRRDDQEAPIPDADEKRGASPETDCASEREESRPVEPPPPTMWMGHRNLLALKPVPQMIVSTSWCCPSATTPVSVTSDTGLVTSSTLSRVSVLNQPLSSRTREQSRLRGALAKRWLEEAVQSI